MTISIKKPLVALIGDKNIAVTILPGDYSAREERCLALSERPCTYVRIDNKTEAFAPHAEWILLSLAGLCKMTLED